MRFASRILRSPRPFDPSLGNDIERRFYDENPALRALIRGAAGCSPYLADLLRQEETWFRSALDHPEMACRSELGDLARPLPDLGPRLRQAKRRVALMTALADLGGVWTLEQVTGWLTDLADAAITAALSPLIDAERTRGRLPGAAPMAGLSVLAMGKMGARELNYSSDIDLICLFDETQYDPSDYAEARAALIRITRKMAALLNDRTADGYVFRTDLRLRPDASVTPVCLSMEAAERYYESVGRTWERAAYIKARPAAGDIRAGQGFLDTLAPFVWRKHLDFAAIQDAHDMRLKIRKHKGLHGRALDGYDLKLGRGGIREIEFFTQTRQLIAGGRDPSLRCRGTVEALDRLAKAGWVPAETATALAGHYRAYREVEHRLQMIRDAQTHSLPTGPEGFDRLAAFMDMDPPDLKDMLGKRLEAVSSLTEDFFEPTKSNGGPPSDFGADMVEQWASYPALRSPRAVEIFGRLKPDLLTQLHRAARPEEALNQFDRFLRGLPAGVQVFSLFEANPQLVSLIVDICATSPALASYLSRNSSVLDAVIGGEFFVAWPGAAGLRTALSETLAAEADYERKLDTARRWAREWHFRVGVHHLRGLIDADEAACSYADLADAVLQSLLPVVSEEFAKKHGSVPGGRALVVAMGSLGAQRLNATSDLDLLVIYEAEAGADSDGGRPLAARLYYARLTQALVTALSAPMSEGRLYEVDMRLRPSGRQGPVATGWDSFQSYQRNEAWTWEHLALTRARAVAGPEVFCKRFEAFRVDLLVDMGQKDAVLADLDDMRRRLFEAKPGGLWNMKDGPGRLQDIELFAQSLTLLAGSPERGIAQQLEAADETELADVARLLRTLQTGMRLLTAGPFEPEAAGEGARAFLLRETGFATMDDLQGALIDQIDRAEARISAALAGARGAP
ncbi:glutamine-synthetase adenylyltransferase [Aestuariibius insulae]|uniref:[protein-PII] uridylyltransferase family protein n=1 Tax=Aestuariibius insulae TaxID=2058287 RepID=UPI00345EA81A